MLLGHGISDIDTGELLSSNNGTIFKANIWGIRKGESGKPGGLCGSIEYNNKNIIGDITKTVHAACMEIWIRKLYQDITYLKKK